MPINFSNTFDEARFLWRLFFVTMQYLGPVDLITMRMTGWEHAYAALTSSGAECYGQKSCVKETQYDTYKSDSESVSSDEESDEDSYYFSVDNESITTNATTISDIDEGLPAVIDAERAKPWVACSEERRGVCRNDTTHGVLGFLLVYLMFLGFNYHSMFEISKTCTIGYFVKMASEFDSPENDMDVY